MQKRYNFLWKKVKQGADIEGTGRRIYRSYYQVPGKSF